MYTVCPKCALVLAVTAADLRAGQGYVRCGRCANVFNALLALTEDAAEAGTTDPDELVPAEAAKQAQAPVPDPSHAPALAPPGAAVRTAVPATPVATAPARPPSPTPAQPQPQPAAQAPATQAAQPPPLETPTDDDLELTVEEFRGTGTYETIVLEGDTVLQTEELMLEPASDLEDTGEVRAERQQIIPAAAEVEVEPEIAANDTTPEPHGADLEWATEQLSAHQRPRAPRWTYAAAVALALLLAGQAINHWRNELATHRPLYGAMHGLARALGEPLQPRWNLAAYDVRQLGAVAGEAGELQVRLSIANRSEEAVGLPLLRLTLLDRYGRSVSRGDLRPEQYLPPGLRQLAFLEREQRIDTLVIARDAGRQATSFELDACLPGDDGQVRCAGDASLVAQSR